MIPQKNYFFSIEKRLFNQPLPNLTSSRDIGMIVSKIQMINLEVLFLEFKFNFGMCTMHSRVEEQRKGRGRGHKQSERIIKINLH